MSPLQAIEQAERKRPPATARGPRVLHRALAYRTSKYRRAAPGRCYPTRMRCSILAAGPPARTLRVPDGSVCEPAMLFHGLIVSTMILIPANALSIWRCTLSTSDFRCLFSSGSAEANPSSSSIECEVNRATEELIRSALISSGPEGFDFSWVADLLSCVAKANSSGGVFSSGAGDVGVSLRFSLDAGLSRR